MSLRVSQATSDLICPLPSFSEATASLRGSSGTGRPPRGITKSVDEHESNDEIAWPGLNFFWANPWRDCVAPSAEGEMKFVRDELILEINRKNTMLKLAMKLES